MSLFGGGRNLYNNANDIERLDRNGLSKEREILDEMGKIEQDSLRLIRELKEGIYKLRIGNLPSVLSNAIEKYITLNQKLEQQKRTILYLSKLESKINQLQEAIKGHRIGKGQEKQDLEFFKQELKSGMARVNLFKSELSSWEIQRNQELKTILFEISPEQIMKRLTRETYGEHWQNMNFQSEYRRYYAEAQKLMGQLANTFKLEKKDIDSFKKSCDQLSIISLEIEKQLEYERSMNN